MWITNLRSSLGIEKKKKNREIIIMKEGVLKIKDGNIITATMNHWGMQK